MDVFSEGQRQLNHLKVVKRKYHIMKRTLKLSTGVTLLEIMLVLAIASMVIVMSIRYYQQASNSQNVNVILEEIQNITAAADNIAQGTGGYSSATSANIAVIAGANNMTSPYGSAIAVTSTSTAVTMSFGTVPASVCTQVTQKLSSNPKYAPTGCPTSLTVVYTSTT